MARLPVRRPAPPGAFLAVAAMLAGLVAWVGGWLGVPPPERVAAALEGLLHHGEFLAVVAAVAVRGLLGGGLAAALGYPVVVWVVGRSLPGPVPAERTRPPLAAALWTGMERLVLLVALLVLAHHFEPLRVIPVALVAGFTLRAAARSVRACPPALVSTALAMGAGSGAVFRRILVPWGAPAAVRGFRMGVTWVLGICLGAGLHAVAEAAGSRAGTGDPVEPATFVAGAFLFLVLGLLWNVVVLLATRRLAPWEAS